jgi:hypothetical protein
VNRYDVPAARLRLRIAGRAVLLVAAAVWATSASDFARAIAIAIPLVIAWEILTLHEPTSVELDDDGIVLRAFGRAHRHRWSEIERLRVRRFAVGDRVLLRIAPASAITGRYWLHASLDGFPDLVAKLEARQDRRESR